MSAKRNALGKGLGALLKTSIPDESDKSKIKHIALDNIVPNPYQPRRVFSEDAIKELADSIQKNTLLQPIVVRKNDGFYEIVNGERRFRAFKYLKKSQIPAIEIKLDDQEMLVCALIENVQRENLNPVEEAVSYQRLADTFKLTHEQLAENLGKSRTYITNSLRLLKLSEELLNYVESGLLSAGGARALLGLNTKEKQKKVALDAINFGWNVRQIEKHVKEVNEESGSKSINNQKPNSVKEELDKKISQILNYPYKIKVGKTSTKIEIEFCNESEINEFLEKIQNS